MAQCPVCQNELPDDFGLIDCGKCKTPLLVQLDGSVVSANSEPPPHPPDNSPLETPPSEIPPMDFDFGQSPAEQHPMEQSVDLPPAEEPMEFSAEPLPLEESPAPAGDVDAMFERDDTPAQIITAAPSIEDLSSLANSVDNASASGVLRYTIQVSGIDTADIRNDFRELINDRRFLWDVESIIKSIRSGTVKLEDVSAVKALLLVHRLRGLPVRVSWEQHVVHES